MVEDIIMRTIVHAKHFKRVYFWEIVAFWEYSCRPICVEISSILIFSVLEIRSLIHFF